MKISELIDWSQSHFVNLPWRTHRSLYRTLVSEIMLQQTTVSTVKNHFERFLSQFPNLKSLASAREEELLIAWKGLGYYRRAKNLKKIATHLLSRNVSALQEEDFFPTDFQSLVKIPGIGPYTANALLSIGMKKKALALDANLERVLSRVFDIRLPKGMKLQKEIQTQFSSQKIFHHDICFRALNEALMDLGRTLCQARKVSCELCPLKEDCLSYQKSFTDKNAPLSLPVGSQDKMKEKHELHLLRVVHVKKNQLLVYRKNKNQWLAGQYEIPTLIISSTDPSLKQYPSLSESKSLMKLFENSSPKVFLKTGITKYKIHNYVIELSNLRTEDLDLFTEFEWRPLLAEESNLSSTTLKIMKMLRKKRDQV